MIKEITERNLYIEVQHKKLIQSINKIQKNAKKGIGNEAIMEFEKYDKLEIFAGKLEELDK